MRLGWNGHRWRLGAVRARADALCGRHAAVALGLSRCEQPKRQPVLSRVAYVSAANFSLGQSASIGTLNLEVKGAFSAQARTVSTQIRRRSSPIFSSMSNTAWDSPAPISTRRRFSVRQRRLDAKLLPRARPLLQPKRQSDRNGVEPIHALAAAPQHGGRLVRRSPAFRAPMAMKP